MWISGMFDTFGLGAGQYMVYDRLVTGNIDIDAPKGFHRGVDRSFAARSLGRDV
jgi:hypothetical protein